MAFVALAVFAVSFVFVDLGFVGIGMPGDYVGYAMTLLAFISLAALLYGILAGGALGLISGVALFIHSKTLPLDFYELLFISEFSSIIALTFVGLPLGLFDGLPYESFEVECAVGDTILAYTDGVTETMNVDGELYGEDRLEELLKQQPNVRPEDLIGCVRVDVAKFAEGAEQSDDITLLALKYGVAPQQVETLVVPARVDELHAVVGFVHTELDKRLCPMKVQNQLDIAVEELFVNVANYAYPDATPENPGEARISYSYSVDPPSITVQIADDGIPYNPLAKPDAVTPDDVMDVPIGGLGILMAKRSVDAMEYERKDNSNVLTIRKNW